MPERSLILSLSNPHRQPTEQNALLTLETERLILYAMSRNQLDLAINHVDQLARDLDVRVSKDVFAEESRSAMLIKISRMDHVDRRMHVWYTYFLLVRAEDRVAVGVCGFKGAPTLFGSVELGYAMEESARNHGYMTEAVRALIRWAFEHDDCRHVTAETLRDNHASQRVLQKAGLELERAAETMLFWKIDRNGSRPGTERAEA